MLILLSKLVSILVCLAILVKSDSTDSILCDKKDYPFHVHFSQGNILCGGTFISKEGILTSAECCKGLDEGTVFIENVAESQSISFSKVVTNEKYNFCILTLSQVADIQNTSKIVTIPDPEELKNTFDESNTLDENLMSFGYNLTQDSLECVETKLLGNQDAQCLKAREHMTSFNPDTMFCHIRAKDTDPECVGNPGSPIIYKKKLIGINTLMSENTLCVDGVRIGLKLDLAMEWISIYGRLYGPFYTNANKAEITFLLIVIMFIFTIVNVKN